MQQIKILSAKKMSEKYDELNKRKYKYPYFYKIKNEKQALYFVGFQHSNNFSSPDFKRLKPIWADFLDEKNKSKIVLVEGGNWPLKKTDEEAIKSGGEAGLLTLWAHQNKIDYCSPEPDEMKEITSLLKKFSKDEIMYYYFARLVDQWHRRGKIVPLKTYIEDKYMTGYKKITNWKDFDFTFENFIKIHNEIHDHAFDSENKECFYDDSNPIFSKIAEVSSLFRDKYIVNEIFKNWEKGLSIFVIYGSGHAIGQEYALRELLK